MPNIMDRFNNNVVGSNNQIYDYIPVISSSGDFIRISGIDVILNSWNNILETFTGSYDNDPEFGCDLYKYVFEQFDSETEENLIFTVKNQIMKYDNRADIENVEIMRNVAEKLIIIKVFVSYKNQYGEITVSIGGLT